MKFGLFISCSILVHFVLFASVFDIYFTSPLVQGVTSFVVGNKVSRVAKRLVLFVADGLRAESFFSKSSENLVPFLKGVMKNNGTWGISHTHIPTESRPGHVALIAGFYEDVSAVMKGWKENPVEFDNVFNQSRETWSWGSPDILPMFAKGSSGSHVHTHCYHSDTESFSDKDSSKLDTWVFNRFHEFLSDARKNESLARKLDQDQIIFFLHLLGIDSNGHAHKPRSMRYLDNIKLVDAGISEVVEDLNEFYHNDGKTAYVFTADHGMTDWGSHGAGDPSETLTPLVVWGAGVNSPKPMVDAASKKDDEDFLRLWKSELLNGHNVEQADVAALMSAILRLPYPVNSVGNLPTEYLSGAEEDKIELLRLNALQIAEQLAVKLQHVKGHSSQSFFVPFSKLSSSDIAWRDREIRNLLQKGSHLDAIQKCKELIQLSLEGLRYYHTYDRTFLYFAVLCSFTSWIAVTVILGMKQISVIQSQSLKLRPTVAPTIFGFDYLSFVFACLLFAVAALLALLKSPWTYYIYCLLPIPIWRWICDERYIVRAVFNVLRSDPHIVRKLLKYLLAGLVGIWLLIGSFFYRRFLSPGLLALSVLPHLSSKRDIMSDADQVWMLLCWAVAIFPNLPTVGRHPNMGLVLFGGVLGTVMCLFIAFKSKTLSSITVAQCILPTFSSLLVALTSYWSSNTGTVPLIVHIASWTILLSSWVFPVVSSTKFYDRLFSIYVWQLSVSIILSLSYDALFCVFLCASMHVWIHVEYELMGDSEKRKDLAELNFRRENVSLDLDWEMREPNFSDIRRSFMLVFLIVNAFFGVGNIASINSFDVRVVLPFATVFNPFIMGALLAYKVLLPYLMVTCSFCGIALSTRMPLKTLCCMVMVISDVMAMHFVFMIKDSGSWLDIGTSISHFVIVMYMIVSLLVFFIAANFLTSYSLIR